MFNPVQLIAAKRDGQTLPRTSIVALIEAFTRGEVADYQMSAFLMACYLQGLDAQESAALTESMLHSGSILNLDTVPGIKVDKHSTGGVGDKVSLILAPTVAACGVPVPMISGRGLGHTGGTIDKLNAIPGFRTDLSIAEYRAQLENIGIVMAGATEAIAPADRAMYALRDVTATVDFIPFIAASIMSKKLAEGIDALVLDVKVGGGAFMNTVEDGRHLAEALTHIGESFGKATVAWMTRMDTPLGHAIGNRIEVEESIRCLQGGKESDLMEVTVQLAGEMIFLGGASSSVQEGRQRALEAIHSGSAFETFATMVEAQGGSMTELMTGYASPTRSAAVRVCAPVGARSYVASIDAFALGSVAVEMGVGRLAQTDSVDPDAGILLCRKPGDAVIPGEVIAELYTTKTSEAPRFESAVHKAFHFSETAPEIPPLLMDRFSADGWMIGS